MNDTSHPPTLGLQDAAKLVRVHQNTLRALAAAGDVPGAKMGRSWLFIETDLLAHVRSRYAEKAPCRSTSKPAVKIGASTFVTQGGGYVGQLERLIAQRRKKSTTTSR